MPATASPAAPPPALFDRVAMAARDPILGLTEQYVADPRPGKVNLGVGVYFDAEGRLPVLRCVAEAERGVLASPKAKGYLPIDGIAAYDRAAQALVFGAGSDAVAAGRIATVQALGGTGALKVGADLLRRIDPKAGVLISDPSWENHRALFSAAGFEVGTYPYYDAATRGIRFDAMRQALRDAPGGTVVVLHACCHNPTGLDLDEAQWRQVAALCAERSLVPFLDLAYQGFGGGIEADGQAVRIFLEQGLRFFVASSFSKSFSLYGERVGALSVVCASAEECARVLSQLKIAIRTNYSSPPTFGAQLVATVLATPALRALWEDELGAMRERIRAVRGELVAALKSAGVDGDLGYITTQQGMFSYSGLSTAQMQQLRGEHAVYGLDSGRLCMAAINAGNLPTVVAALAAVM